jgi:mono/diheme cytochrome c family protein
MQMPSAISFALPFTFMAAIAVSAPVTFNKDIAPIIFQNCSSCHRPGEAAPFALLSYADVKKKAKTIAEATESRVMPPWKAEPASFAYRNERRLSDAEIALIQAWVKSGMAEGRGEAPAPPKFAANWALGEPDLIVEMPAAYHIPADGPDIYRNIAVPLGLTEDKWVTAIDMKPSARAAVHHVLYFADPNGKAHEKKQGAEPGFNGMRPSASIALGGFALGAQPGRFPDGFAMKVPKGSDFVVQYHFHPTGKPEAEKSRLGFYFAKQPPERLMTRIQMPPHYSLFSGLEIPPGEKDFVIRDSYTVPVAVDALGIGAHAHYIAKQMKMTATLPDGEVKTLLWIKDWDFAWQDRYYFKELVALPKGTKLDTEIHWDNSAKNPRNPSSPPVRVTWGEESKDEMGSVSLIATAHEKSERSILQKDIARHQNEIVAAGLKADPTLGPRIRQLLAE